MADPDFQRMMQTTLDLVSILDAHREHEANEVMGGLMRFAAQLETAKADLVAELQKDKNPDAIFAIMMRPNPLAARFGAMDFLGVNTRASQNFADLVGVEGAELSEEARADIMVWLSITGQTIVAAKLLFQTARLYGRAPNGKSLAQTG